jgi:predicted AlkP superfamily pyrophosphatase or phosphodiesterase
MKRLAFQLMLVLIAPLARAADPVQKPKLIVAIVVDQCRFDYTTRFAGAYSGGLARLLAGGAVFSNARYDHVPTVTAVGHSIILSGAMPSTSGIIANEWYDRESGRQVTSVFDGAVRLVGGEGETGASPRRLLVSTLGDEMKIASGGKARVIGISLKDRSAILLSGHMSDAAYWFESRSGHFVTSSFYLPELPGWVREFNEQATESYKGAEWLGHKLPGDNRLYQAILSSPFSNDMLEAFAERAIQVERLGKGEATDLLTISFSANDYVGHQFGPDAPEVKDTLQRTDRTLGRFLRFLDSEIGLKNVLVVFTGDHGVAPVPEVNAARMMPGGRIQLDAIQQTIQAALGAKYGEGKWIVGRTEGSLYLNLDLMREKKLARAEVETAAKEAAFAVPHTFRIYTYDQIESGRLSGDPIARKVVNSFFARRAADLYILLEPYWVFGKTGTSHGSAFGYDSHVPVILMGPGIRAGRFDEEIAVNDIAPTLATLLGVETPSGSVGRVLTEAFDER